MSEGVGSNAVTNYYLLDNKKPETRVEIEKIPQVREAILVILKEDKAFWAKNGQNQPGLERNILLRKVCDKVPINSNIFGIALEELECEQRVMPFLEGSLTRYLLLDFKDE